MFWFDKSNPLVLFADIREESHILCDGRPLNIKPDVIADFRKMPWNDETFSMVVFDPPHLENLGSKSWMALKYGKLDATWQQDIHEGFRECMRVLKTGGTLIFKWNENRIKTKAVIRAIGQEPLFGHTTKNNGQTIWMAFIKQ